MSLSYSKARLVEVAQIVDLIELRVDDISREATIQRLVPNILVWVFKSVQG